MSELDNAITSAEAGLAAADASVAELRGIFIAQTGPWLAAQWTSTVEDAVRRQHELSQSLGREALGDTKRELGELVSTADDAAREHLAPPGVWVRDGGLSIYGNRPADPIGDALRTAMGLSVPALERRGYTHDFDRRAEGWRYRYGFEIAEDMKATLHKLNDAERLRDSAVRQLSEARTARAEAEAGDLWGSA